MHLSRRALLAATTGLAAGLTAGPSGRSVAQATGRKTIRTIPMRCGSSFLALAVPNGREARSPSTFAARLDSTNRAFAKRAPLLPSMG